MGAVVLVARAFLVDDCATGAGGGEPFSSEADLSAAVAASCVVGIEGRCEVANSGRKLLERKMNQLCKFKYRRIR
jgi:hypothetical protein